MRFLLLSLMFISSLYAYKVDDIVVLGVIDQCSACKYAEIQLDRHHIPYTTREATTVAPELYVNGVLKGYGTDVVDKYIEEK